MKAQFFHGTRRWFVFVLVLGLVAQVRAAPVTKSPDSPNWSDLTSSIQNMQASYDACDTAWRSEQIARARDECEKAQSHCRKALALLKVVPMYLRRTDLEKRLAEYDRILENALRVLNPTTSRVLIGEGTHGSTGGTILRPDAQKTMAPPSPMLGKKGAKRSSARNKRVVAGDPNKGSKEASIGRVIVESQADSTGTAQGCQHKSEKRAEAVCDPVALSDDPGSDSDSRTAEKPPTGCEPSEQVMTKLPSAPALDDLLPDTGAEPVAAPAQQNIP